MPVSTLKGYSTANPNNTMEAIILNRTLSKKEIKSVEKLITPQTKIYRQPDIPCYFSRPDAGCETIPENDEEKKRINYTILDKVLNFGELKIDNSTITDMFLFGSLSMWHYSKFNVYFSVRNLYYEINFLKKILEKHDKIFYFGNSRYLEKYFNGSKILFFFPEKSTSKINYFQLFKFSLVFSVRVILSLFQKGYPANKKHVLIDNTVKQKVLNPETLKAEKSDITFYYLNSLAGKSFMVLEDLNIPTLKSKFYFRVEGWQFRYKNKIFGDVLLFKGFFNKRVRKEFYKHLKKTGALIKSIDKSQFDEVHNIIFYFFEKDLAAAKFYLYKYTVYKHFFKNRKFKSVTTIDENSARFKSILDAAKENGIKTIGIQHGTIHDLHPAYIYTANDKMRNIQSDYTLVWGDYWKEFLINRCNYNPGSLIVTGQIRTDIIHKLLNSNLELPQLKGIDKKIVVFASQPQRDAYLRRKAAEDVFNSVKDNKNLFLTVKLHQAEKNDTGYYHDIAKSTGITNYTLLYWVDLYHLFSKSDIVITCFSTVGSEAVYFNKPLIILDPLKQDLQNYHREGVAFQATGERELKNYIEKIVSGELKINREAYNNFIKKYAYKIDGHTTERVLNFIKSV
jgi:hypothetical protein